MLCSYAITFKICIAQLMANYADIFNVMCLLYSHSLRGSTVLFSNYTVYVVGDTQNFIRVNIVKNIAILDMSKVDRFPNFFTCTFSANL